MQKSVLLLGALLLLFFSLCFYQLDDIPGEWYGDISIEHQYVSSILAGDWPTNYSLSAGPLYHYAIAPIIAVVGDTYYGYKVASIVTAALTLLLMYLVAKELWGESAGIFAAFSMASSFWFVVWARLGSSPQVLSPGLVLLSLYGLIRWHKTTNKTWLIFGGVCSSLGLLSYPALYVLPPIYLFTVLVTSRKERLMNMLLAIVSVLPVSTAFLFMILGQSDLFSSGYIGEKLGATGSWITTGIVFIAQYFQAMGALFLQGDHTFRVNVPGRAHLDVLAQLCLVLGIVFLAIKKTWWKMGLLLIPFLVLSIPSISPGIPDVEIPSSSRTFGMVSVIFLFVGFGIESVYRWFKRYAGVYALALPIVIIAGMGVFTVSTYFGPYPLHLPNHNSAFGKYIAAYIDTVPNIPVYLSDCCWGEWGQPEPKGIYNSLKKKEGRLSIVGSFVMSCDNLAQQGSFLLIMNPHNTSKIKQFTDCFPFAQQKIFTDRFGQPVYVSLLQR